MDWATQGERILFASPSLRGVRVIGSDGHRHALVANFGQAVETTELDGHVLELAPDTARVISTGSGG